VLWIFTTFTFAADKIANTEDWRMISGHQFAKADRDTDDCDPSTDGMCFNDIPTEHVKVASDPFDAHGMKDLRTSLLTPVHIPTLTMRRHEHRMAVGIAQDLFYELNEENWEYARPYDLLLEWSQDPNIFERYHLEKSSGTDLTVISYLPENLIGRKGMRCDVDYEDECRIMPTLDDILIHYPHHRHRARQLKFSLIAIQRYYIQGYTFVKVLNSARKRLDGHCPEFAKIFFHEAMHHKERMCPEDIINIIIQVIMTVVAIQSSSLRQSIWLFGL
jgi:hypothetical protein